MFTLLEMLRQRLSGLEALYMSGRAHLMQLWMLSLLPYSKTSTPKNLKTQLLGSLLKSSTGQCVPIYMSGNGKQATNLMLTCLYACLPHRCICVCMSTKCAPYRCVPAYRSIRLSTDVYR